MTLYERIKAATIEEMAQLMFVWQDIDFAHYYCKDPCPLDKEIRDEDDGCAQCVIDWLNEECSEFWAFWVNSLREGDAK